MLDLRPKYLVSNQTASLTYPLTKLGVGMRRVVSTVAIMKQFHAFRSAALFSLLGIFACIPAVVASGIDDNAKALAKVDEDWSKTPAKRDAALLCSYYAADAVLYPPNDVIAAGRPAALKLWTAAFADPTYSISWKAISAQVSKSGELGVTEGTYSESYKGTDGKMVNNTGKYVTVWAMDKDANWKATQDIWNPDK
jgi:ketosteroid isomerase-like protein